MHALTERARAQWGLATDADGVLAIDGCSAASLADRFGTPLHVVALERVHSYAREFLHQFESRYAGKVEVFYAVKCNAVCGILQTMRRAGLGAEVFSPFELRLAQMAGHDGGRIIVNGPAKTPAFVAECVEARVKLIVADSLHEIELLSDAVGAQDRQVDVLLRVNVDYVPRGMSPGSSTGSRNSVFGMLPDDVIAATRRCAASPHLRYRGLHMHIGSNIRRAHDYRRACARLCDVAIRVHAATGLRPDYLDVGGGIATPMVREFSSLDFVFYHGAGRLPAAARIKDTSSIDTFADAIAGPVLSMARGRGWEPPTLIVEPGRCLVSANQVLLLRVLGRKQRPGRRDYVLTDGGQMSVNFPTFFERHVILPCRAPFSAATAAVDIVGPGCYSSDFVCRNVPLPAVEEGDLLAVMDSGAYFLSFEGNFGFPRAAVVAVQDGVPIVLRAAETYADMLQRERRLPEDASP